MKKSALLLFVSLFTVLFFTSDLNAQLQRNPVLEYCTGTWCGYCPCGHAIIRGTIVPNFPNAIIIGYHGPANGSDPYSTFNGNSVISSLGFSAYPTGIVDRTSPPISRSAWYSAVSNRNAVNATIDINILKTYDASTRQLDLTVIGQALETMNGNFNVNVVITEDGLIANQTGYTQYGCYGAPDYRHEHVVRTMVNGATGQLMNSGEKWNVGEVFQKQVSYSVPAGINADSSHLVVFIYQVGTTLNTSTIQQAKQWSLVGNIVPVELTSFTASVNLNKIILTWETASEKNNHGFTIEKSSDGQTFIPAGFITGKGTTTEKQYYTFTDIPEENGIYFYRLRQQDYDGSFTYSEVIAVKMDLPVDFSLAQNFPNPFNPVTTISYSLPVESFVTLSVYDVMGREIASLVKEVRKAGTHDVYFDASGLASGTYIYKIAAGNYVQSRKLMVLK